MGSRLRQMVPQMHMWLTNSGGAYPDADARQASKELENSCWRQITYLILDQELDTLNGSSGSLGDGGGNTTHCYRS